jgi:hypothetical protein
VRRLALIVVALALLVPASASASPYTDAVGGSAPWGWWRLGEASGPTVADQVGLTPGTWSGTVSYGLGGALDGDADTAISIAGGSGLSLGTGFSPAAAFTIEAWVNLNSRTSTRYLLSKGSSSAGFHLLTVSAVPNLRISTTGGTFTVTSPTALPTGTWHHLAGTYDGAVMTLYVDGAAVASRALTGTVRASALPLTGGRYSSGGSGLNGRLDELAVYDRALSALEIAGHAAAAMSAGVAGVSVAAAPAARTDDRRGAFTLSSTDPQGTFTCALDSAAPSSCSATPSWSNLADGVHTVAFAGTDRWGRAATGSSYAWTIDQKAASDYSPTTPTTRIDASVGAATQSTDATFTLSASRTPATFSCSLDGGSYGPCGAKVVLSGVSTGSHVLRARATDRWGQTDPDGAAFSWTVDHTTPDTALAMAGPGTAAFSSTEPGTFQCRFDDGAWTPCASPATVPAGNGIVSVRAIDAAGNADPSPANVRRPEAAAAQPTGAGTFTSTGATLTFAVSSGGTPQCRLDDGAWAACASPASFSGLAWGDHAFALRAVFANGLTVAAPEQRWSASAPAARIAALQFPVLLHRGRDGRARVRGRAPNLRFALNVAVAVKVRIDRVRGRKTRLVSSWTVAPSRGDHVVKVADRVLKRLKRGRYRVTAQPAGGQSVRASFAVV